MKSRKTWILASLAAAGLLAAPGSASAWVAVRAGPAFFGAAAVGVAAGAVAGAAVASAAQPVYVAPQPVYVAPAPPPPPPPPPSPPAVGTIVGALPPGCVSSGGRYQCGSVWYQPYFGSSGVYYQVVAP
jgi:hypothetical protein